MAHEQQRTAPCGQLVHQPQLGGAVQVVGRLVEDHEVGLGEQHPDEVDPPSLAARQRVDVGQETLLGQPQPVGQPGQAPLDLVAAGQAVPLLEGGEPGDFGVARGLPELAPGAVQLVVQDVQPARREDVGQHALVDPEAAGHRDLGQKSDRAGPVDRPGGVQVVVGTRQAGRRAARTSRRRSGRRAPTFCPEPTTKDPSRSSVRPPTSMVMSRAVSIPHSTTDRTRHRTAVHRVVAAHEAHEAATSRTRCNVVAPWPDPRSPTTRTSG